MIVLSSVSKTYGRAKGRSLVLDGANAVFQAGKHYVIFGQRGSGKSTLLRVMSGMTSPSQGRVKRYCSVSLPVGSAAGLAGAKTVRELTAFLASLYDVDPEQVIHFAVEFSKMGDALDLPVTALSPSLRARLSYAIGYALPTGFYLFDDAVGYGDPEFRSACLGAFELRRQTSGTIVATRDTRNATLLGEHGGVLYAGKLYILDTVAEAVEIYQRLDLENKASGLSYAETLIKNGDLEKAREYLKQYLSENEDGAETYELLADLSLKSGNFSDAVDASWSALDRSPNSVTSHIVFAKVAERERRFADAIASAEKVLEASPGHREALVLMAKSHESLGIYDQAARIWHEVAKSDKDSAGMRLALRNYIKAGNWEGVLSAVDVALTEQPNDVPSLVMRARSLLQLRRWAEAKRAIVDIADSDLEKAIGVIYHLVKSPDWRLIPELLSGLHSFDLAALRSSRTMSLLLVFLERQAARARMEGLAAEAGELWEAVKTIDPYR